MEKLSKPCIIPILRAYGATIGENCDLETGLIFHNCSDYSNLVISDNCHIGKNCFLDLKGKITIEENVVISMRSTLITHQDFGNSKLKVIYPSSSNNIIIKKHSYIGANSTILKGATINEFSVVAACSLVLSNIPPKTLVGGSPAKIIKPLNGV